MVAQRRLFFQPIADNKRSGNVAQTDQRQKSPAWTNTEITHQSCATSKSNSRRDVRTCTKITVNTLACTDRIFSCVNFQGLVTRNRKTSKYSATKLKYPKCDVRHVLGLNRHVRNQIGWRHSSCNTKRLENGKLAVIHTKLLLNCAIRVGDDL